MVERGGGGRTRAPRNRTITLTPEERQKYLSRCIDLEELRNPLHGQGSGAAEELENRTICGDLFEAAPLLPEHSVDLLFVDPPYNMYKRFSSREFTKRGEEEYARYTDEWLRALLPCLKPNASVYVCSEWRSSAAVYRALSERLTVRNRITWEREKGRGAKMNWKNSAEDIWFATLSDDYYFDVEAVKMKRSVIAPYRSADGSPKDWRQEGTEKYRYTSPSNIWTDITVPYWSMPENTDHPTQKPEKLLAKIILASSAPGAVVADPFLGSGSTSVAAKKLGRRYIGIEREEEYAALAEKRLAMAESQREIQGFEDGVFLHRNSRG